MKKREREREREERGNTKRFPARKCWRVENKAWNAFSHSFFLFKEKHFFLLWSLCRKECINRGLCRKRCIGLFFHLWQTKHSAYDSTVLYIDVVEKFFCSPHPNSVFSLDIFLKTCNLYPLMPRTLEFLFEYLAHILSVKSLKFIIVAHAEVRLHFLRSRLLGSTAISDHYMQVQP